MKNIVYMISAGVLLVSPAIGMKRPNSGMPEGQGVLKKLRVQQAERYPIKLIDNASGNYTYIDAELFPFIEQQLEGSEEIRVNYSYDIFPLFKEMLRIWHLADLVGLGHYETTKLSRRCVSSAVIDPYMIDVIQSPELLVQTIKMLDYFSFAGIEPVIKGIVAKYAHILADSPEPITVLDLPQPYNEELAKYYYLLSGGKELPGIEHPGYSIDELIDSLEFNRLKPESRINRDRFIRRERIIDGQRVVYYAVVLRNLKLRSVEGLDRLLKLMNVKNTQVNALNLSDNQLVSLPDEFISNQPGPDNRPYYYPRLEQLMLDNNQLTRLPDNFLHNASIITDLHINNNKLEALPAHFLSNAPRLKDLDVSSNRITSLPADFLHNSPELEFLFLDNNQLSLQEIQLLRNRAPQAAYAIDKATEVSDENPED